MLNRICHFPYPSAFPLTSAFRSSGENKEAIEKENVFSFAYASKTANKREKVLQTSKDFLCSVIAYFIAGVIRG